MFKNKIQTITLNKAGIKDFAKERNNLLSKSKAEWVFFLDKDETFNTEFKKSLDSAVESKIYNGFYIKRENYMAGKYVGTDYILRVVKKGKGKWHRAVHEQLIVNGKVGVLKGVITHNTAESVYKMVGKINFYSTLHATENIKQKKEVNIIKIILFPILKFLQSITKGRGVVFSILQSFHSFLAWSKQWELQKK